MKIFECYCEKDETAKNWKDQCVHFDCCREIDRLNNLLKIAVCPSCDKSGAYYDNMGNVNQCQWCYEVK